MMVSQFKVLQMGHIMLIAKPHYGQEDSAKDAQQRHESRTSWKMIAFTASDMLVFQVLQMKNSRCPQGTEIQQELCFTQIYKRVDL